MRLRTVGALAVLLVGFAIVVSPVLADGPVYPQQDVKINGKKPARFPHTTHVSMGLDCGVCHHDENHNPRDAAAIAALPDKGVLRCVSCHDAKFANAKLRKAKAVFHARCRACHKAGYNDKKGPTRCNSCHIKKKRPKLEGC